MSALTICTADTTEEIARCRETVNLHGASVIDWVTTSRNTRVRLHSEPIRFCDTSEGAYSDLLALAIAVYMGDQLVSRLESPDGWSRDFSILFPVNEMSRIIEVIPELSSLLSFVTGDSYSITTMPCEAPYTFVVDPLPLGGCDAVALFSGGADSLAGAIWLLEEGMTVCLVGHYADAVTYGAQKNMIEALHQIYPGRIIYRCCFIRKTFGKNERTFPLAPKQDANHRVRSFLFLGLAFLHMAHYSVERVYIPENGIIGLNVPLSSSRAGTCSTRTSHPLLLNTMSGLASFLAENTIPVTNPFLLKSKTEVLLSIPEEKRYLLPMTISCSKYDMLRWEKPDRTVTHCGYCLPCIYRRIAMHRLGMDEAGQYHVNPFSDLANLTHKRTRDLRALVSFLRKYSEASSEDKVSLMMSNGHLPVTNQRIITIDGSPYSVNDFVSCYDRFAVEAIAALHELCSPEALDELGL